MDWIFCLEMMLSAHEYSYFIINLCVNYVCKLNMENIEWAYEKVSPLAYNKSLGDIRIL